jgi:ferredoxin
MMRFELLPQCNGCKACELACAFRATGCFWTPASAIRIRPAGHAGERRYEVGVDPDECDLCQGESVARCQWACGASCGLTRETVARIRGGILV